MGLCIGLVVGRETVGAWISTFIQVLNRFINILESILTKNSPCRMETMMQTYRQSNYFINNKQYFSLIRNTKLLNFTKPGNPGTKFKGPFEKMIKSITLPKIVKEDMGILDDNVGDAFILSNKSLLNIAQPENGKKLSDEEKNAEEAKTVKQLLSEGKYQLLPSFFRTMIYLKKMKKEFSVVFRAYNS